MQHSFSHLACGGGYKILGLNLCVISLTAVAATPKLNLSLSWVVIKKKIWPYICESNFTLMPMKLPEKKA